MSENERTPPDSVAQVCQIEAAIRDFHHALDLREDGGSAGWRALQRIEEILEMPWQQGAEQARRAEKIRAGKRE